MADTLTRETLDRLDAYAQQREAEWSRGMDCEQAIAEPDERCTVTIWELQQLIVEARRTVPGLVQYNALMAERDTARAALGRCRDVMRSAIQCLDVAMAHGDMGEAETARDDLAAALKEDDHG